MSTYERGCAGVCCSPERMGQRVLEINGLTHGYGDRLLYDNVDLEIEKGERVAIIGVNSELAKRVKLTHLCAPDAPTMCSGLSSLAISGSGTPSLVESCVLDATRADSQCPSYQGSIAVQI